MIRGTSRTDTLDGYTLTNSQHVQRFVRSNTCLLAKWSLVFVAVASLLTGRQLLAQGGLRESLEKLDKNQNGYIDPDEITPLARPYLERITEVRRMSLREPIRITKLQETARIYYALQNGASGKTVQPEGESSVKPFGPAYDEPIVPGFGLGKVKYPYTQADLDFADKTIRRSDRNRDGLIDRAEAADAKWTHRNPFEMDLNKDNRLSRLELAQRYARRRMVDNAGAELVKKAIRTGSGIRPTNRDDDRRESSSDWWRKGGNRYWLTSSILGRFDANRNGRLEMEEAQNLGIPTSLIDVNLDSELSRDELFAYFSKVQDELGGTTAGLPAWFYELDEDRDGQVAMAEFTTEWTAEKLQEFASYDTNDDGLLTELEMIQSKAIVGGSYFNEDAEVLAPHKTVISEIEVTEGFLIADLNIQLSITHSSVSQLDGYLTGPDGQRIELFTEIGGSGDHFDETIFDDQSREHIVKARPPFKGSFIPEGLTKRQPSLNSFNGKSVKGVWQLVIRGSRSDRFGMLHSWGLIVKPQESEPDSTTTAPESEPEEIGEEVEMTSTSISKETKS
ncbi:MAG: calcium sensor EFh [Blastopirellula sp.]|nr:MAG: calcium sensor EFh [Blastopirellula sp.]